MSATVPLLRVWSAPPIGEADDDALMADAAAGKTQAYATLVRRHHAAVRAYCVRSSGSQSVGDDLAQDVFLTVWQTRAHYERRGRFRSYLFTLARNACKNQIRNRARGAELPGQLPEILADGDPFDEMVINERRRRVHDCVSRLPWAQRDALLLRYTADLEYAEIARIVGKPEATIGREYFLDCPACGGSSEGEASDDASKSRAGAACPTGAARVGRCVRGTRDTEVQAR